MSKSHLYAYYWTVVLLLLVCSCQDDPYVLLTADTGSPVSVVETKTNYSLRPFTQILTDTVGGYTIEEVAQPAFQNQFQPYSDHTLTIENHQYYWCKVQVQNSLPDAGKHLEWVFRFSSTWTTLEVYTSRKDGGWEQQISGIFTPSYLKAFTPTTGGNLVKIALPPQEIVTIYFRGSSERQDIVPSFYVSAEPSEVFYSKLLKAKKANALFTGFLLMMLFYNLIVYLIGRDRSFIFYSGYLLMVALYVSYSGDDIADWLGTVLFADHPAYYNHLKLSLFLGLMCYLAFIRSFLDLDTLLPRWDRYFWFVIYLSLPLIVLSVIISFTSNFSYVVEDRVSMLYIALVTLSCLFFIYPLYKTRDVKGYFVVAGIAVISIGFSLTFISRLLSSDFTLFYLKVGTVIEILIFSLGLAYRQRKQQQDKQAADFALRESQLIQEKKQLEADRLQELSEFQSRFYTNITHEFRTPLTVIMGMSENIKGHSQEKSLIQRNSQNLLRLINQLLDLSKVESGGMVLNKVHRDIIVYLQYLTESFYSNASQKNIRLVFHSEEKEVMMDYDEEKIQQIVYNLLSNALKFTPEAGRIIFYATKVEQQGQALLKLKVKDTGVGIAAEDLPVIFDRFYQVNRQNSNKEGGTGIGLALTKELIELMNGRITVESEVGAGTEFIIYLAIEANVKPTKESSINVKDKGLKTSEAAAVAVDFIPLDKENEEEVEVVNIPTLPELLIIEDNPDIITYIKTVLKTSYNFQIARNGAIGIEKALEVIPDIIISDVMMPEKNGYEVCEALKQDERTSHIPIILLTAKSTQQDKVEGLTYGADAYLTKPFDKEELTIRLEKLIAVRQQLQQRYANNTAGIDAIAITPSIEDVFLQKLQEQIQIRLNDTEFGVPQLAAAAHLSQMQLYRKLKALTDKTPSQFIRSYRLQKGLELLKEGQLTVSEVAYEVGFADPSYFSRTFQKEFKRNPSYFLKD